MSNTCPIIYIGDDMYEESFKQVYYKGRYYDYIISSFGRLFSIYFNRRLRNEICLQELHPTKNKKGGYYQYAMMDNGIKSIAKIHRLVALSFVKNPEHKKIINHIDGIKENNYFWNLEWVTYKENTIHAYKIGLETQPKGESRSTHKYTTDQIKSVCDLLQLNYSIKDIHKMTLVSKRMIKHILIKDVWPHIVADYDFSSYNFGKPYDYIERVVCVCHLLSENSLTLKEIADKTGITYAMVKNILDKKAYTNISKDFNISNFSNYQTKQRKK